MVLRWIVGALLWSSLAACAAATGSPSLSAGGEASLPAGFPLGSWTTTISRDDLQAGGITEQDLLDQNEGVIVFTFRADGTWDSIQTSTLGLSLREPVFRGRFSVTAAEEVRIDPVFPAHYAAEGLYDVVRWRLASDVLYLTLVGHGDPIVAVVYGAHPWRRP